MARPFAIPILMSTPATVPGPGFPLVVIGMHRSGTSLVARLLAAAGVQMGADRNVHDESDFFRESNQLLLRAGHADWDWPLAMQPVLGDADLCELLGRRLERRCRSRAARGFLGRRFGTPRLLEQGGAWGWKDPRTTLTLPIWLRVFPQLRVVHVFRDGVDVAASLVAREQSRRLDLDSAARSSRCREPRRAFELWSEYVEIGLRATADLQATRVHTLRFESLLESPEKELVELLRFAACDVDGERLRTLAGQVIRARGERFRDEPAWIAFRRDSEGHPSMLRLGYGTRS